MAGSTGSGGAGLPGGNAPASNTPVKAGPGPAKPPPVNAGGVPPKQSPGKPVVPSKPAVPKAPSTPKPSTNKNFNWMAPLSPAQVQNQAINTIKAAYAPAKQSLDQQETRAQAIASKQQADNTVYRQWLDTMMAQLQAHQDMSNQAVINEQNQIQQQQKGLYSGTPGTGGYGPGNPEDLHQLQARNQGLIGSAETQATSNIGTGSNMVGATRENNYGIISAANTKSQSALNTALTNIANQRTKLDTSQRGDLAKEVARLQGVEINKVSSNRSYSAAIQKLGISAANTASNIQTRATQLGINQQNANTALTKAQQSQMNADRNFQLNQSKFDSATAKDQYLRDHGLGPYRPTKNGQKPALSQSSQNVIFSKIDTLRAELNQLVSHGQSAQDAYHTLMHGGQFKDPKTGKVVQTYKPWGDIQLLNAAYNTMNGASGLTPGDVNALHGRGLTIGSRYQIAPNPNTITGAGTGIGSTIGNIVGSI